MNILTSNYRSLLSHAINNTSGYTVLSMTFAELIEYGKAQPDANIVEGMPWSFKIGEIPVTHENDQKYLIGGLGEHFTDNDILLFTMTTEFLRQQGFTQEYQIVPKELYNHFFK